MDLLEALEFLERPLYGRVHRRHVKLGDLRTGELAGISDTEADTNEVIVFP